MSNFMKNLLKEQGYMMVALPKASIKPLLLLVKEGKSLSSLDGNIDLLFKAQAVPIPKCNVVVADISGKKTLEFKLKVGLKFLDSLFSVLKLSTAKLKAEAIIERDYKVDFCYEEVSEDSVGLLDIDAFLSNAVPLEGQFKQYMDRLKKSKLYIITSTLKSKAFSLDMVDKNGQSLDLNASLKADGKGHAAIQRSKEKGFTIRHQGEEELVFAFKAYRILYNEKKWFEFWRQDEAQFRIKKEQNLMLRGIDSIPGELLEMEEDVVDL